MKAKIMGPVFLCGPQLVLKALPKEVVTLHLRPVMRASWE